jgi:hypothetical protein
MGPRQHGTERGTGATSRTPAPAGANAPVARARSAVRIAVSTDGALSGLYMEEHLHMPDPATFGRRVDHGFEEAAGRLGEYFAGDGGLTGYAGGLARKRFQLDLERPCGPRPGRLS